MHGDQDSDKQKCKSDRFCYDGRKNRDERQYLQGKHNSFNEVWMLEDDGRGSRQGFRESAPGQKSCHQIESKTTCALCDAKLDLEDIAKQKGVKD